jgi:RNA polymerase sigma-70 factor (ECF subfamily)
MQNKSAQTSLTLISSDDDLVLEAQSGSQEAFSELMRRHSRTSFQVALSMLRDAEDAADEVQNAYWKAYSHIGGFEREARFSTWITRIVMNQCLMRLRQQRRARFVYMDDMTPGEDSAAFELPSTGETPETALAHAEIAAALRREIDRIPPLLRHALVLREVQELPMPQVAGRLGISIAAAKSRLLRARRELRNRMEKYRARTIAIA